MMTEMEERVARLICREAHMLQPDVVLHGPSIWRDGELDAKVDVYWPKWVPAARAAIAAMKEAAADPGIPVYRLRDGTEDVLSKP